MDSAKGRAVVATGCIESFQIQILVIVCGGNRDLKLKRGFLTRVLSSPGCPSGAWIPKDLVGRGGELRAGRSVWGLSKALRELLPGGGPVTLDGE